MVLNVCKIDTKTQNSTDTEVLISLCNNIHLTMSKKTTTPLQFLNNQKKRGPSQKEKFLSYSTHRSLTALIMRKSLLLCSLSIRLIGLSSPQTLNQLSLQP